MWWCWKPQGGLFLVSVKCWILLTLTGVLQGEGDFCSAGVLVLEMPEVMSGDMCLVMLCIQVCHRSSPQPRVTFVTSRVSANDSAAKDQIGIKVLFLFFFFFFLLLYLIFTIDNQCECTGA